MPVRGHHPLRGCATLDRCGRYGGQWSVGGNRCPAHPVVAAPSAARRAEQRAAGRSVVLAGVSRRHPSARPMSPRGRCPSAHATPHAERLVVAAAAATLRSASIEGWMVVLDTGGASRHRSVGTLVWSPVGGAVSRVGEFTVPPVAARERRRVRFSLPVPPGAAVGRYAITVCLEVAVSARRFSPGRSCRSAGSIGVPGDGLGAAFSVPAPSRSAAVPNGFGDLERDRRPRRAPRAHPRRRRGTHVRTAAHDDHGHDDGHLGLDGDLPARRRRSKNHQKEKKKKKNDKTTTPSASTSVSTGPTTTTARHDEKKKKTINEHLDVVRPRRHIGEARRRRAPRQRRLTIDRASACDVADHDNVDRFDDTQLDHDDHDVHHHHDRLDTDAVPLRNVRRQRDAVAERRAGLRAHVRRHRSRPE